MAEADVARVLVACQHIQLRGAVGLSRAAYHIGIGRRGLHTVREARGLEVHELHEPREAAGVHGEQRGRASQARVRAGPDHAKGIPCIGERPVEHQRKPERLLGMDGPTLLQVDAPQLVPGHRRRWKERYCPARIRLGRMEVGSADERQLGEPHESHRAVGGRRAGQVEDPLSAGEVALLGEQGRECLPGGGVAGPKVQRRTVGARRFVALAQPLERHAEARVCLGECRCESERPAVGSFRLRRSPQPQERGADFRVHDGEVRGERGRLPERQEGFARSLLGQQRAPFAQAGERRVRAKPNRATGFTQGLLTPAREEERRGECAAAQGRSGRQLDRTARRSHRARKVAQLESRQREQRVRLVAAWRPLRGKAKRGGRSVRAALPQLDESCHGQAVGRRRDRRQRRSRCFVVATRDLPERGA
jgi:hypothetical protein